MDLTEFIRDVVDFPKPGIIFKDITPLLSDYNAFDYLIGLLAERYANDKIDKVCGIESRGFVIGAPLALRLGAGFIPIRKAGKLPCKTISYEYDLEYGKDKIEIHEDAISSGERVLLVDDLVATGGTALAAIELIKSLKAELIESAFVIELVSLGAHKLFEQQKFFSLLKY